MWWKWQRWFRLAIRVLAFTIEVGIVSAGGYILVMGFFWKSLELQMFGTIVLLMGIIALATDVSERTQEFIDGPD